MEKLQFNAGFITHQTHGFTTNDIFIDTVGTCFLCLKDNSGYSNSDLKSTEVTRTSLKQICRYLKIHPPSTNLLSRLKWKNKNKANGYTRVPAALKDKRDYSVKLCPNCYSIIQRVTESIYQLELAKMRLDHRIRELNEIFKISENIDASKQWEQLKDKLLADGNDNDNNLGVVRVFEHLRSLIGRKCSSKIKTAKESSLPKVHLEKLKILPPTTKTKPKRKIKGGVLKIFDKCYKTLNPGNYYQCLHCDHVERFDSAKIRHHSIGHHVEKVFEHMKLPSTTTDEFRTHSVDMLLSETVTGMEAAKNNPKLILANKRSPCWCASCDQFFTNAPAYRYHLVMHHLSRLEQKLIAMQTGTMSNCELQKLSEIPQQPDMKKAETKPKEVFICSNTSGGCSRKYPSAISLHKHKINNCPNRQKAKQFRCDPAVGGCGRVFAASFNFKRHMNTCKRNKDISKAPTKRPSKSPRLPKNVKASTMNDEAKPQVKKKRPCVFKSRGFRNKQKSQTDQGYRNKARNLKGSRNDCGTIDGVPTSSSSNLVVIEEDKTFFDAEGEIGEISQIGLVSLDCNQENDFVTGSSENLDMKGVVQEQNGGFEDISVDLNDLVTDDDNMFECSGIEMKIQVLDSTQNNVTGTS